MSLICDGFRVLLLLMVIFGATNGPEYPWELSQELQIRAINWM